MLKRLARAQGRFQRSIFAFPAAVLVAGMMIMISEGAYQGAEAQLRALTDMGKARINIVTMVRRIVEAESAQRGYLITDGRKEYLIPYRQARADVAGRLQALEQSFVHTGHVDVERQRREIALLMNRKFSELEEVISLFDQGRKEAAQALVMTNIGRDQMDAIRDLADKMLASENAHIATGLENVFDTLLLNRIGVATMTAVSLLMLALFLRQGRTIEHQRQEQARELIAERDRLENEVRRRTSELTELARHLQTAREDERARLARDLHDELGAMLTAAKLDVARIRPHLVKLAPDLIPRLTHLTESLNSGIALKRRIIEDLRPSTLDNLGLSQALQIHCKEFTERSGIRIEADFEPVSLTRSAELTLFRMVQEALNNVAKYSHANLVTLSLRQEDEEVRMRIEDDGVGFDPAKVPVATHGLLGMRFRIEAESGSVEIRSSPGAGTLLIARIPACPLTAEAGNVQDYPG